MNTDQQQQLAAAKAAGERRMIMQFTPEQRREWQATAAEEAASQSENVEHFRKVQSAAREPGFFGDVRRAILASRRPVAQLAAQIGVEPRLLSEFQAKSAELPATAVDRLLQELHLRLMFEIPGQ